METKEKAKELANKFVFKSIFHMTHLELIKARQISKKNALIAVDEIIKALEIDAGNWIKWNETKKYWQEVKQEIINL